MYTLAENLSKFRSPERAEFEDKIKREAEEQRIAPIIAAQVENNRLTVALLEVEKQEIEAGRPDPSFVLPESAAALKMSFRQAKEFARAESETFVAANPDYYRCRENFEKITSYLTVNGVVIPNSDCFRVGYERLKSLGLLIEKPAEPEPAITTAPEAEVDTAADAEEKRRRGYFEDAIYTDPDKPDQKMTAHQLSKCDAETYRRVMRIPRAPFVYSPRDGATHR